MSVAVDHAVVNVLEQMDDAAARFRAMGFTLTERGYHSLGSINHLMMFGTDYLELVGIEPGAVKVRREVADSPIGLNGLVIRTADARILYEALKDAGIPVLPPVDFDRPVEFEGRVQRAAFTTVRIDPAWVSGGRIYFCEHKTPHLVWQPQWQQHENGAAALAGFTIVAPAPAEEGRRYAGLLGSEIDTRGADDVTLDLGAFRLALCTRERYRERYGDFGCASSVAAPPERAAFMGALAIRVESLAQLRACLQRPAARDVRWRTTEDRVTIDAASAYDCAIDFVA